MVQHTQGKIMAKGNFRRITTNTLWNAMEGLSNEEVVKLRESRDELLIALKIAHDLLDYYTPNAYRGSENNTVITTAINNASK